MTMTTKLFGRVAEIAMEAVQAIESEREEGFDGEYLFTEWDNAMDELFTGIPEDVQREVWSLCDQYLPVAQQLNGHTF